jgi:hypothetical protein
MSNIIVTTANSLFYYSVLTLINSIHKHSFNLIDKIIVFNLGLCQEEINRLKKIKKVSVVNYPDNARDLHSKFLEPKQYVYKVYCLKNASSFGSNILWLDAGIMALEPIDEIFNTIEKEHIFLVGDVHLNKSYTHKECIRIMNASEEELAAKQLSAGIIGYKVNGNFQKFVDEAYKFSLIEGCVDGGNEDHRHDQSVFSILAARYKIKTQSIDTYGYWTNLTRDINSARQCGAILFVHRRSYHEVANIVYDN